MTDYTLTPSQLQLSVSGKDQLDVANEPLCLSIQALSPYFIGHYNGRFAKLMLMAALTGLLSLKDSSKRR